MRYLQPCRILSILGLETPHYLLQGREVLMAIDDLLVLVVTKFILQLSTIFEYEAGRYCGDPPELLSHFLPKSCGTGDFRAKDTVCAGSGNGSSPPWFPI